MFYVKIGYYGNSCDVCGKSSTALPGDEPMFVIVADHREDQTKVADRPEDYRMIFAHMDCFMKHLNEAREKLEKTVADSAAGPIA